MKGRCECEHSRCHPDGDCKALQTRLAIVYGIIQAICTPCYRATIAPGGQEEKS